MAAREICRIYKKVYWAICSNYRPVTLFKMAYKKFTIILNRLWKVVNTKLSEAQAEFRTNRSTLHNIFLTRQTYKNMNIIYYRTP